MVGTAEYQVGVAASSHEKNLSALNPGVHTTSAPVDSDESTGADLWHLAAAIHVTPEPGDLTFLTLDRRQREVAAALGFEV